jgi:hypothetical protein
MLHPSKPSRRISQLFIAAVFRNDPTPPNGKVPRDVLSHDSADAAVPGFGTDALSSIAVRNPTKPPCSRNYVRLVREVPVTQRFIDVCFRRSSVVRKKKKKKKKKKKLVLADSSGPILVVSVALELTHSY